MPINTTYSLFNIKGLKQPQLKRTKIKVNLTAEEQLKELTKRSTETLQEMVKLHVPEKGRMPKAVSVSFDIPATNNHTILTVEESAENKQENRDLIVGVRHKQRDRLLSKLLVNKKSKQDILKYLLDSDNQVVIIKNIKDLSKSTDDYYSKL